MADTGNPIRFEDLIHSNVETGLDGLITKVGQVQGSLLDMLKSVKKEASALGEALSGTSSASKGDRDAIAQYTTEIEKLHKENEKLTSSLEKITNDLEALKRKKKEDGGANDALITSYASLQDLLNRTKINLDDLNLTEKARIQIAKNGQAANTALGGSYNQLYAQYNLVKTALNAMTDSMRNSAKVGKVWEAEGKRIMDTMKRMQEATGKHTLSVGNYEQAYSKAMNGLTISTQQVLREMPTLANSLQQFFIAISNNVPIFVDNLKAVQKETGSWVKAMKGVLTSIISWQTALLVVLTILPKLAKGIHDKKKAQEEDNEVTKAAKRIQEELNRVYTETDKTINQNISRLRNLYAISQDTNRSMQDRVSVAKVLKQEYEDAFANYSAEEIALGNAKTLYDELTKSLVEQAKARAYLNKITELESQAIDQMAVRDQTKAELDAAKAELARAKARRDAYDTWVKENKVIGAGGQEYAVLENAVSKAEKAVEKANAAFMQADMPLQAIDNKIDDLRKKISAYALDVDKAGKKQQKKDKELKDFYWEWRESILRNLEDEQWRAIGLSDLEYEHKIANLKKELEERRKAGTLTEQQERYLTDIILGLEKERQTKRQAIIKKYYEETLKQIKYYNEVEEEEFEEPDFRISTRYNRLLADNAEKIIAQRKRLNESLVIDSFKEAKAEGKAFKELTIEKLRLEEQYQEELLEMRRATGLITQDEYTRELAVLQINLAKSIASLNRRRRTKFSLWNLIFGETMEDGKGNVWKELSPEAQAFVNTFEQAMSSAFRFMDEWMDKRIEMAEVAVEAAKKETEAAKSALDYEQEARANGYANNVELARNEYEEKLKYERLAIAEKQRLQRIQENIDTAQQISSLVTATAELWEAHASIPFAGRALAIAATAAMWSSFLASKVAASQLATTKYGEGMSEYLNYGGSHASGNDIDFGVDKNGKRRRVERGEMIGVINKKNVDKYGVGRITDIITSLNNGTFESKYSSLADVVLPEMNADLYHLAFAGFNKDGKTDLGVVESSLQTLIEQGETRVVNTPYGRIEYKGNNKRIIRNS